MNQEFLGERWKALEEAFFANQNKTLLQRLRESAVAFAAIGVFSLICLYFLLMALYTWLTGQATKPDGPGDVKWNFAKFLVDRTGQVAARFEPKTAPSAPEVKQAVEKAIGA